jgi:DNA-directed RNA polymerases I and III subunit RPAC2
LPGQEQRNVLLVVLDDPLGLRGRPGVFLLGDFWETARLSLSLDCGIAKRNEGNRSTTTRLLYASRTSAHNGALKARFADTSMSGLGAEAPRGDAVTTMEVEVCGDESAATFTFHNEDHTIGNTVRYMLNKMPETSFVGYSVPHPAEPKMNLRLQTVGPPATQVLHEALGNLYQVSEHVLKTFEAAVAKHRTEQGAPEVR